MIAFDIECSQGHSFEGWFENKVAFDEQEKNGLIECPICGDTMVTKKLSTFSIGTLKSNQMEKKTNHLDIQKIALQFHNYVNENFENVGSDFAKEALKIHFGVADPRNIRGVSTKQEEEQLKEEGIEFIKFPAPRFSENNN